MRKPLGSGQSVQPMKDNSQSTPADEPKHFTWPRAVIAGIWGTFAISIVGDYSGLAFVTTSIPALGAPWAYWYTQDRPGRKVELLEMAMVLFAGCFYTLACALPVLLASSALK